MKRASKFIRLFWFALVAYWLLANPVHGCDITVQVVQTGNILLQGGTATLTITVGNTAATPNPAYNLVVNTGPNFVGVNVISPIAVGLNNPGLANPELSIPAGIIGAQSSINIVMTFGINNTESCDIISDLASQPYVFNSYTPSIGSCGTLTDNNASGFYVFFPKITVLSADNPGNVFVGQVLYRKVELINQGNLTYDISVHNPLTINNNHTPEFQVLDIAHSPAPGVYTDLGATINNGGSNTTYDINTAAMNTLTGGNTLAVYGSQVLTYYEKLEVLQCNTGSAFYSSDITPRWTVNGEDCATDDPHHSFLTRQQGAPDLAITTAYINPPRDFCYGTGNLNTIRLTLSNGGTAPAHSIILNFDKDPGAAPGFTEIIPGSIVITRTAAGNTTTLVSGTDYTITPSQPGTIAFCDGAFYHQSYDISFAGNLTLPNGIAAQNNIIVTYDVRTCCPGNPTGCYGSNQHYDAWKIEGTFGGFCDGHTNEEINQIWNSGTNMFVGNSGGFAYEGPFNIFVPWGPNDPPTVSLPYDVIFSYTGTPPFWPYNVTNTQFYVDITMTESMTFCDPSINGFQLVTTGLGILTPVSAPVFITGSNVSGPVKTLRIFFDLATPCGAPPCTTNLTTALNNSDLEFCIQGNCPNVSANGDGVEVAYYYNPDLSCAPSCVLPIICEEQPVTIQCPGCLRQGIHANSYRITRTTYGFADQNNNGRWNGTVPTQITAANVNGHPGVRTKRVMFGDEFQGVLSTVVKLNGYQPDNWTYGGSTPPQLDFYNGYWHSSFSDGQNVTPVSAEVEIIEYQTTPQCAAPPCTTLLNLAAPISFTADPNCYAGMPGTDFYYDFSISALQAANPGVPNIPQRFSHNMELRFRHVLKQTGNVGPNYVPNIVNNLVYLSVRPETSPNVYVPGGCLQDPDVAVAAYAIANGVPAGEEYDEYCTGTGTPFPCEDIQWFCTRQGDSYTQVGIEITGVEVPGGPLLLSPTADGCYYPINYIREVKVGPWISPQVRTNAFPYEYRNWSHFHHFDLTFPAGITPLGINYWEFYLNGAPINWGPNSMPPTINNIVTNFVPGGTSGTIEIENFMVNGSDGHTLSAPNFWFRRPDDDYYLHFQIALGANCFLPDGPLPPVTVTQVDSLSQSLVDALPGDFYANTLQTWATVNAGVINRNDADLTIDNQTPNPTTYGYNDPVEWSVFVTNTASSFNALHAANPWIAVTQTGNSSPNVAVYSLQVEDPNLPGTFYDLVDALGNNPGVGNYLMNTLYYVPVAGVPAYMQTIPMGGAFRNFRVRAFHVNCSQGDELMVHTGWLCNPRVNTLTDYNNLPCGAESVNDLLLVDPTPVVLGVCVNGNGCDINYVPVAAQPCSTVTYEIEIYSNDQGFIDNGIFNMTLLAGSGLSFSGNATIEYNGTTIGSVTPSGNTLNFDFTHPAFTGTGIDTDGLPGLLNANYPLPNDHYFTVTVTLNTSCEFSYDLNGGFELSFEAMSCMVNFDDYLDYYNPIIESPTFAYDQLDVALSYTADPNCPNVVNGSITVTNNAATASNSLYNVLYLNLPAGFTASGFSIAPTNPFGPSPYTWSPAVLGGLSNGGNQVIYFTIVADNAVCSTYNFNAAVYTDDYVVCQAQPCSVVHVMQNENTIPFTLTPPPSQFIYQPGTICQNQPVQFSANVNCPGIFYSWDINSSFYNGNPVNHTFNGTGLFPVTLMSSYGVGGCYSITSQNVEVSECFSCDSLSIWVFQKDKCVFDFEAVIPPNGNCVFTDIVWNFGDGNSGSGISTSHQYQSNGIYEVCYTWYCYDSLKVLLDSCVVCDSIVVLCGDSLCKYIENVGNYDIGEAVIATDDGGCAVAGTLFSDNSGTDSEMYFVKYDSQLDASTALGWTIGGNHKDRGYSVVHRINDGYYIAGTVEVSSGERDIYIAKLDEAGNFQWAYRYGFDNNSIDEARKIIDMSTDTEDALLVVGYTNNTPGGDFDVVALKIRTNGAIMGTSIYGAPGNTNDFGNDVDRWVKSSNSIIYYIVGERRSGSSTDAHVIKIDQYLTHLNSTIIDNNGRDEVANAITIIPNQSGADIYVAGSIVTELESISRDLYLFRLDHNLNPAGVPTNVIYGNISSTAYEVAYKMKRTSDGNLIIAAENGASTTQFTDGLIMKVDASNLAKIWASSTTPMGVDEVYKDVAQTSDGFYVSTGRYHVTNGNDDMFITKHSPDGNSCCTKLYKVSSTNMLHLSDYFKVKQLEWNYVGYGSRNPYYVEKEICKDPPAARLEPFGYNSQVEGAGKIYIFPNPASDAFSIVFEKDHAAKASVSISDVTGKTVKILTAISPDNGGLNINTNELRNGIYMVTVTSGNDRWHGKVTINK